METDRKKIHDYWTRPWDGSNAPAFYLSGAEKSRFLIGVVKPLITAESALLEVGCNVGRNLNALYGQGFTNLAGIEISADALALMAQNFPEIANKATIHNCSVEDCIKAIPSGSIDMVYTMAVLEHIHTDSEWVFAEMVRISRGYVVTIEDEVCLTWRHFPRKYKEVFEGLGMKQVSCVKGDKIKGLGKSFYGRVFKKGQ